MEGQHRHDQNTKTTTSGPMCTPLLFFCKFHNSKRLTMGEVTFITGTALIRSIAHLGFTCFFRPVISNRAFLNKQNVNKYLQILCNASN